jgi:hypothetical protein
MPRRAAVVTPRIPLFLIGPVVTRNVKEVGEELVRIVVKQVKGHFFDISVRTRSVCRALRPEVPRFEPAEYCRLVADP